MCGLVRGDSLFRKSCDVSMCDASLLGVPKKCTRMQMSKELILLGFASLSSRNGVSASKLGEIAVALGGTRQTTMVSNAFDGQG